MIYEHFISPGTMPSTKQFHLDNNEYDWDHNYILDEVTDGSDDTDYTFDEMHLMKNALSADENW